MATRTVLLREGDGYACSCGYETADTNQFKSHMATYGRMGHKSAGKVDLKTHKSTNEFYYDKGLGTVKLSYLSGKIMKKNTKKKTTKKKLVAKKTVVDETNPNPGAIELKNDEETPPPQEAELETDDTPEDTREDTPEDTPGTKGGKSSKKGKDTSRTTDYMPEATLLRLVPKVYQMTLTPTVQMTFHLARNVFPHIWPSDWSYERILDDMLIDYWADRDVDIGGCTLGPTALESIRAANNGSQEGEEVKP